VRWEVVKISDFIIYTASDPDAFYLADFLRERGFIVPSDDLADAAMVLVVMTTKKKLMAAIGAIPANRVGKEYWKVRKVADYSGKKDII